MKRLVDSLPKLADDGPEIYSTACQLLEKTEVGRRPSRLLEISLSQLTVLGSETQLDLFYQDREAQKKRELHTAIDSLHEKFGEKGILPGTLIKKIE